MAAKFRPRARNDDEDLSFAKMSCGPEPLCNQQHSQATNRRLRLRDRDITLLHRAEMWSRGVLANDKDL